MRTAVARRSRAWGLGKMPTTSVRRLSSRLSRSSGLLDQSLRQWASGKSAKAVRSALAWSEHRRDGRVLGLQEAGDDVDLGAHELGGGLGEDGADGGGDHLPGVFGDPGGDVALEVDAAALPGGAGQDLGDGGGEPAVLIRDHQADTGGAGGQPPVAQGPQELGPERLALTVTDVHAEDLTAAVGGHTSGDDHRLGDDPAVEP